MQEKDRFLKKLTKSIIYFLFFFVIFFSKNITGKEVGLKIDEYIKSLDYFSSKFIQSNGNLLEEGNIYIKDKKIRLDYFFPKRSLILSKKKGVYINHELREEEFFSTKKNTVGIFYDIFLSDSFFSSLIYKKNNNEIFFEKEIIVDSTKNKIKVFFENNPILLRKITLETMGEKVSISFNDHNYNAVFEEDFFSFVPIYPN